MKLIFSPFQIPNLTNTGLKFFSQRPYPAVFRAYSWLCSLGSILVGDQGNIWGASIEPRLTPYKGKYSSHFLVLVLYHKWFGIFLSLFPFGGVSFGVHPEVLRVIYSPFKNQCSVPYRMPGIKSMLAVCKANTLLTTVLSGPPVFYVLLF